MEIVFFFRKKYNKNNCHSIRQHPFPKDIGFFLKYRGTYTKYLKIWEIFQNFKFWVFQSSAIRQLLNILLSFSLVAATEDADPWEISSFENNLLFILVP